ncbi:MAG: thioredoxin family protein [Daejeonella sp.]|uniref:thioredoxin family protein n=1 Tax=Daejeonella sp. JGW-45 TaxID=3034148 RepID=UPI0023EBB6BA|nr:thioredoxin family protein [Daejeonella sp. JGW-45]
MFKGYIIASVILLLAFNVCGQNRALKFDELNVLQAQEARPVVVLISTSWCKFCHAMKNSMLRSKKISTILADKYRTVFLDAEEKDSITFAGRTFRYEQGVNGLAKELGTINGQVSYPTLCILNKQNEIIYQQDGYLSPDAITQVLAKLLWD